MMDRDVIHEAGHHYVVRVPKHPGRPERYEIRRSGIVSDKTLVRISGQDASEAAIAYVDRLALADRIVRLQKAALA
ncbi:hypothetical protein IPV08_08260 [Methylobacterium sp. SD274]|jgi:hypothetical protein|uniref:hypothetical protein n=1 Tax=Methylobacterium sp. SD274 TaxID=2782009 RepID=UPI001A96B18A|nr:hypothetical protein [Methylobacterium sp. SD274]MBO1019956.1 hypothetical protein [Methylobacterium sp. SD274]